MRILLTLLCTLSCASAFAQLPEAKFPAGLGVNIHFTDELPGEVQQIAAAGFKLVRMDFTWSAIEQNGQYNFDAYDRLMASLDRHKLRPIFILDYTHPAHDENLSPHTDAGRAAFARFAAAGAKHFRGRGVIWEIYNEPNLARFWKPKPNVADYIKLAEVTAAAIREVDPTATIIGPATSGIDLEFLRACVDAGLHKQFAGISVHPYTQAGPETAGFGYRKLRAVLPPSPSTLGEGRGRGRGPNDATSGSQTQTLPPAPLPEYKEGEKIIAGEWGYSDIWSGMNRDKQAIMLARQFLFNASQRIPISIWYDWRDDGTDPNEPEHHFGIVEHNPTNEEIPLKEKPAYRAAKALTMIFEGYTFRRRVWTGDERDWVLMFARGNEVRMAAWTTAPFKRRVSMPASRGGFRVLDLFGEDIEKLDGFNNQIHFDLSNSPIYIMPTEANAALSLFAAADAPPLELRAKLNESRGKIEWTCNWRNPSNEQVGVLVVVSPPPESDGVESIHKRLEANESAAFKFELPIARRPGPQFVDVYLSVAGVATPLVQRVALECANPISVALQPLIDDHVQLVVTAPPGETYRGKVTLRSEALRKGDESIEVDLKPGASTYSRVIELEETRPSPTILAAFFEGDETPAAAVRYRAPWFNAQNWKSEVEGDAKVAAEHKVEFVSAPLGLPHAKMTAAKFDYRFDAGWRYAVLKAQGYVGSIDRAARLGLWIKGDGSGNASRIRYTDAAEQTFQVDGPKLDFTDWRYVEFPLNGTGGTSWGGNKSGEVQYPLQLDCLLLIDSADRQKTAGTIYIAGPSIIEE